MYGEVGNLAYPPAGLAKRVNLGTECPVRRQTQLGRIHQRARYGDDLSVRALGQGWRPIGGENVELAWRGVVGNEPFAVELAQPVERARGRLRDDGRSHQHPAIAPIHAVLKQQISGNVVAGGIVRLCTRRRDVLHHPIAPPILNPQGLALGIELSVGDIFLVGNCIPALKAVMGDRHHLAPQTVQVSHRRCISMNRCQPGCPTVFWRIKLSKVRMIPIGSPPIPLVSVIQDRVAAIPGSHRPGRKLHPVHRAIG